MLQNAFNMVGRDNSHPHQTVNFQYIISIISGREVSKALKIYVFLGDF